MTERIVEVEWEDSTSLHGWHDELPTKAAPIRSTGYVFQDDDDALVIYQSYDGQKVTSDSSVSRYGNSLFIPRSAIRKVTELARKR
ncbi:hypothetical protein LCGC14_1337650 [marine sediment metagenome]|uniref:Uncharacterized protein n=1 Tax=marine sediment metagenome TaxID=412755 RepID=A0A0F9L0Z0_9ZZZZ